MTEIVLVQPEDTVRLIPLALKEAEELKLKNINPEKLRASLKRCAENGAVFASKEGKHYTGLMALLAVESWWGDVMTLCNLIYYVEPEYRNGAGLKLLKVAREFAKEAGLELNIFTDTDTDHDRKDRMFLRYGFERRGGTYRSK